MALCSGVAVVTLTFGVLGSTPALTRRLMAVRIPIPVRPLAVFLTMATMTAVLARPRPADATVPPPIVRLSDEIPPPPDEVEASTDNTEPTASAPSSGRSAGTLRSGSERTQLATDLYVIQEGDCLWRIAASTLRSSADGEPSSADIARFWPVIYEANRAVIGDNPSLIFPGQQLLIPEA